MATPPQPSTVPLPLVGGQCLKERDGGVQEGVEGARVSTSPQHVKAHGEAFHDATVRDVPGIMGKHMGRGSVLWQTMQPNRTSCTRCRVSVSHPPQNKTSPPISHHNLGTHTHEKHWCVSGRFTTLCDPKQSTRQPTGHWTRHPPLECGQELGIHNGVVIDRYMSQQQPHRLQCGGHKAQLVSKLSNTVVTAWG